MLKIGITGGIGSGKSTVCAIFNTLGIPIYYADTEAKKLYDESETLKNEIVALFGEEIYTDGKFNKNELAKIVFHDAEKLAQLNKIVHPLVQQHGEQWFEQQITSPYAIKEAALLIESGNYKNMDFIILVTALESLKMQRVMQRDAFKESEVMQRMQKQSTDEWKLPFSNFVIENDEEKMLIPQVVALHEQLLEASKKNNS